MAFRRLLPLAALFGLIGLVGLTAGCSNPKPQDLKRVKVSGKITLDKVPLKTGKITFDPQNGEPPASLDVLDGNYEGKVPVGKNKVMISATRMVSLKEKMKMDGPGYDQMQEENLLPPRYNTASQITREVEASGENTFNFDLTSN